MSYQEDLRVSKQIGAAAFIKLADDQTIGIWDAIKQLGHSTHQGLSNINEAVGIHPIKGLRAMYEGPGQQALRHSVEHSNSGFLGSIMAGKDRMDAHSAGLLDNVTMGDRVKGMAGTAIDHPVISSLAALAAGGGLALGGKALYDSHQKSLAMEKAKAKAKDDQRVLHAAKALVSQAGV